MFAQIIAICIFVTMFLLIILDKFERHYITLGSGALVLVLVFGVCMRSMSAIWETLNLGAFFQSTFWYGASEESTAGINWSTILFIAGMMIMVEGLGKAGFFRWLCLTLAKLVHYRTVPLLICFMSLSAFCRCSSTASGRAVSRHRHARTGADDEIRPRADDPV